MTTTGDVYSTASLYATSGSTCSMIPAMQRTHFRTPKHSPGNLISKFSLCHSPSLGPRSQNMGQPYSRRPDPLKTRQLSLIHPREDLYRLHLLPGPNLESYLDFASPNLPPENQTQRINSYSVTTNIYEIHS